MKDPKEVVTVQQKVKVTVVEVDIPRKRIGLSMKSDPFADAAPYTKPPLNGIKHPKQKSKPSPPSRHIPKPQAKELTMEEKLAMLVNKFKK